MAHSQEINSQSHDYLILEYDCNSVAINKLVSAKEILFVFPSDRDSLIYKEQTSNWRKGISKAGAKCIVKYEQQLSPKDFNKNMLIFGNISKFKNWNTFKIPIKRESHGFKFGDYSFTEENDAISFISDTITKAMRYVIVGNSTNSLKPIVNNWRHGYNYSIFENGMITHFGNCTDNSFDETKHVYLPDLKNKFYKLIKTEYYDFHISKRLESQIANYKTKLDSFDLFVNKYIDVMKLKTPTSRITCFIHADNKEISYISTHFGHLCGGTTYGIVTGNEIHSLGFNGAIAHESSHIIFNSIYNKFPPTFFSEGIRQYYDYAISPEFLRDGIKTAQQFIEEDISPVILGHQNFFQGDKYYKISGVFVKYLIDKEGLDTFKKFYSKINARNIDVSLHETYSVYLETCMNNYRVWLKKQ